MTEIMELVNQYIRTIIIKIVKGFKRKHEDTEDKENTLLEHKNTRCEMEIS
jgi:hypothetical protein